MRTHQSLDHATARHVVSSIVCGMIGAIATGVSLVARQMSMLATDVSRSDIGRELLTRPLTFIAIIVGCLLGGVIGWQLSRALYERVSGSD